MRLLTLLLFWQKSHLVGEHTRGTQASSNKAWVKKNRNIRPKILKLVFSLPATLVSEIKSVTVWLIQLDFW